MALGVAVTACRSTEPIPQAPQAVQTQKTQSDPAAAGARLRFSAVVEPDAKVPVAFRIPGYVTTIAQVKGQDGASRDLAEGDRVTKGAVLVRIRSTEYEDKLRQATSQAAAAQAVATKASLDYDRANRLYGSQSLTKTDYDGAKAQLDATQSALAGARALVAEADVALQDTAVTAPFDGEIVKKTVERGAFVGPGVPVFGLARTDVVKIVIGVPDIALRSIALGSRVDVTVDACAGRTFQARVSRIASAADPQTRNFEIEVAIPNPDHALKVGMIGSLELATADGAAPAASPRVPLSAIVQAREGQYGVYLASAGNGSVVARLRPVEIGPVVGTDVTVVRGLQDGDEVITSGANLLKDGQKVEVVK